MSKKRRKSRARKKRPVNRPVQSAASVKPALPAKVAETQALAPVDLNPAGKGAPARKTGKRYQTAALSLVMLAAVALAAWFGLSPTMEKNRALEHQSALLDSIENGDGVIVLEEAFAAVEVDFYDDAGDAPAFDVLSVSVAAGPEEPDTPMPTEAAEAVDATVTGIGVLTIDAIGLKLPVAEGVSEAQLKVAVGHVPQTAAIGDTGNAVIAGHRSYTHGQFFNRLGELTVGDVIRYQSIDGEVMEFTVYETLEILPGDPAAFEQPEDKQVLTLYTCTPVRTASHRLLVRAEQTI